MKAPNRCRRSMRSRRKGMGSSKRRLERKLEREGPRAMRKVERMIRGGALKNPFAKGSLASKAMGIRMGVSDFMQKGRRLVKKGAKAGKKGISAGKKRLAAAKRKTMPKLKQAKTTGKQGLAVAKSAVGSVL